MTADREGWLAANPWLFDLVLAVVLLGLSLSNLRDMVTGAGVTSDALDEFLRLVGAGLVVAMALLTAAVRTWPVPTAVLIGLCAASYIVLHELPVIAGLAAPYAIYVVAWIGPSRRISVLALVAGLIGCGLAAAVWGGSGSTALFAGIELSQYATVLVVVMPLTIGAWLVGDRRRSRDALMHSYAERARLLETEVAQQAVIGAAAERQRIARDLHDIIAHSLTVMVLQADGGRAVLGTSPAQTELALQEISSTGRAALAETRSLLGILRDRDDPSHYQPQPGLADLAALVKAAGPRTRLTWSGPATEPSMSHQIAAYRVVQEALTNVRKHAAAPGQVEVSVAVEFDQDCFEVTVSDNGPGLDSAPDQAGSGIRGMRERVQALGGTLHAGPRPGGGFLVNAHFPNPYADRDTRDAQSHPEMRSQ